MGKEAPAPDGIGRDLRRLVDEFLDGSFRGIEKKCSSKYRRRVEQDEGTYGEASRYFNAVREAIYAQGPRLLNSTDVAFSIAAVRARLEAHVRRLALSQTEALVEVPLAPLERLLTEDLRAARMFELVAEVSVPWSGLKEEAAGPAVRVGAAGELVRLLVGAVGRIEGPSVSTAGNLPAALQLHDEFVHRMVSLAGREARSVSERDLRAVVGSAHELARYCVSRIYDAIPRERALAAIVETAYPKAGRALLLEATLALDRDAFPTSRVDEKTAKRWFDLCPEATIVAFSKSLRRVYGYLTTLPVQPAAIEALYTDQIVDADLGPAQIDPYTRRDDPYMLYVVAVVGDPSVQDREPTLAALHTGFVELLRALAARGCRVGTLIADAFSTKGTDLCSRYGMEPWRPRESSHGTYFYELRFGPRRPQRSAYARELQAAIFGARS